MRSRARRPHSRPLDNNMSIYLDSPDPQAERSLFGDELAPREKGKRRGRQQVVYCAKCDKLDSLFWGGGKSTSTLRCATCNGEVFTSRANAAKLKFYDAIMQRCLTLTIAAAHGNGDIDAAAQYAEYAAHTCFALRLVPYGPEPDPNWRRNALAEASKARLRDEQSSR